MSPPDATLLVVDDNEMNRDLLSRRLTRQGYTVFTAESGAEALRLIDAQPFDLALFDIMMPEVSGLEALARLRAQHTLAELPVIMVTAKAESEDVVEALKLGANDYITKPIDFPVLLARVRTHLALKRLDQLKDEFIRIASHDLKSPLTEILGTAGLVEAIVKPGVPLPEEVYRLLLNVKGSARKIQRIIEDFLDFQALEEGELKLTITRVDLNAVAEEVVRDQRSYAAQKGLAIALDLASPLPPVLGDRERLTQVLENLVNNALKFSPAGTNVTVATRRVGDRVVIEVKDEGPGLREPDFALLFVKYARLSNRPTAGEKSTGLGLAIAKQLVDRMGGTIGARNNPERGATFYVALSVGA